MRHRLRAALKFGVAAWRINQQGTSAASERKASRLVAVKSNALGSPQTSPITAASVRQRKPSSIAHSTSTARDKVTMMMGCRTPIPAR